MPRPRPTPPAPPAHRPTAAELRAAQDRLVPDVAAPGLRVLFCGINPGLYSAAVGRHFARPGNRFWPVLHRAGFTPRQLAPWESDELLRLGYGITNVVRRATATAAELDDAELRAGGRQLRARVRRLRPRALAVLGIGAYRHAFARPEAALGPQPERLGDTLVWVLPNPSGLNAHYGLASLAGLFEELRRHVEAHG
jgi:TDG/mug DNA glycosylase family protein